MKKKKKKKREKKKNCNRFSLFFGLFYLFNYLMTGNLIFKYNRIYIRNSTEYEYVNSRYICSKYSIGSDYLIHLLIYINDNFDKLNIDYDDEEDEEEDDEDEDEEDEDDDDEDDEDDDEEDEDDDEDEDDEEDEEDEDDEDDEDDESPLQDQEDNNKYLTSESSEDSDDDIMTNNSNLKTLPPVKKHELWTMNFGNVAKDKCWSCRQQQIISTTFHVGHVRSRHDGGTFDLINLRPICQSCNSSMRTKNMVRYMYEHKLKGWNILIIENPLFAYINLKEYYKITDFDEFLVKYSKWCKKHNWQKWENCAIYSCLKSWGYLKTK